MEEIVEEGKDQPELSEDFKLEIEEDTHISVFKRSIMGELDTPCLYATIDSYDQYVAGTYSNGEIKIYDPHGGGLMKTLQAAADDPAGATICTSIKWKPGLETGDTENVLLAGDNVGNIIKYDASDAMLLDQIKWDGEEENKIYCLDYSSNARQFAAAGLDGLVRIYDDITMKLVQVSDPFSSGNGGHSNRVFSVKFNHEDPNILISGGWDNNIIIHDVREKGPVDAIIGAYICGDALDFSGEKILSGSNRLDKQLQLWDLKTWKLLNTIDWNGKGMFKDRDQCKVFCAKFMTHPETAQEYILAGGGETNECRIFNSELEPIINVGEMSRGWFTVDSSSSGDSFLCAGGDGVIRLFRIIYGVDS